jgi:hypothetical protein
MTILRCWHFLGGTGVSPVQAQAKAWGYQISPGLNATSAPAAGAVFSLISWPGSPKIITYDD